MYSEWERQLGLQKKLSILVVFYALSVATQIRENVKNVNNVTIKSVRFRKSA